MIRVIDIVNDYFKSIDYEGLAYNTKLNYESSWNSIESYQPHGTTKFAELDVTQITPLTVENIKEHIVRKRGAGAAKLTFALMYNIWQRAYRTEKVKDNPWARPGLRKGLKRDTTWPSTVITRFVHICRYKFKWDEMALIFLLIYETGQRPIDILTLKKSSINLEKRTIQLKQKKTGAVVNLLFPEYLMFTLSKQLECEGEYVFPDGLGSHRSYAWLSKRIKKVRQEDSTLSKYHMRDLRRTAITESLNAGATDWQAQNLGGHANPQSTIPYRVLTSKEAHAAQNKRWQSRTETDFWNEDTPSSDTEVQLSLL